MTQGRVGGPCFLCVSCSVHRAVGMHTRRLSCCLLVEGPLAEDGQTLELLIIPRSAWIGCSLSQKPESLQGFED